MDTKRRESSGPHNGPAVRLASAQSSLGDRLCSVEGISSVKELIVLLIKYVLYYIRRLFACSEGIQLYVCKTTSWPVVLQGIQDSGRGPGPDPWTRMARHFVHWTIFMSVVRKTSKLFRHGRKMFFSLVDVKWTPLRTHVPRHALLCRLLSTGLTVPRGRAY